ncbi:DNA repair protein RAD51 4 [Danaus plexippus plexippus]|uniref:DNA repair protein RAD51 4 n=1 Tax=Danaus plexippus plexippus TaxID=278856 RepID=A0A212EKR9_DANPL|nr:DNA repair protein RAD51 4 [Danaus plexippus plexippus]
MLKLKLEDLLTDNELKSLNQNRITTLLDFLQEDTEKLSILTQLTLPQILEIRNNIFKKYSAEPINGTDLYITSITKRKSIQTGIKELDSILDRGIPSGIIEICGLAGSGKSQLCMQIAINCVKDSDNTILYIDTKGDFSALRIQKILDLNGYSHKDMAIIMLKIKIVRVWTIEDLIELIQKIKSGLIVVENLALVIIDSLPCLVFQHFGDDNKMDGESTSVNKGSNYIEKANRCLGKYWENIPAILLILKRSLESIDDNSLSIRISATNCNNPHVVKTCMLKVSALGVR